MTDYAWARPDAAELRDLLDAVSAADGRPSLPEDGGLPGDFRSGEHLLATRDGLLVGYTHLDPTGDAFGRLVAELMVRPAVRREGIGTELLARLLERVGIAADGDQGDTVRVWAHGDQPAAAALAKRFAFRKVREMYRLRMPLGDGLPGYRLPDGVTLRPFVRGQDEDAVTEVNRLAFAWHPEQGALTADDVRAAEDECWFDAPGFLLAVDGADRLLGFHWTKVHATVDGGPMGEVYVIGVRPDAQGGGLGRALTLAGLRYLRDERHVANVMLYVESDNKPALAVYDRLGFVHWDTDVQYAH